MFPPDLVRYVRSSLPDHPALDGVGDEAIAKLLTLVFFASLERDEGEHLPIRVVFGGGRDDPPPSSDGFLRWTQLPFIDPRPCSAMDLRRLSRATIPDWTFVHAGIEGDELVLLGLARRGLGGGDDPFIGIVSTAPGRLEVWALSRRVLEYAHGRLIRAPENVILSAGPVQRELRRIAVQAGASANEWPIYVDTVGGMVRAMAAHGRGGILIVSSAGDTAHAGGYATQAGAALFTAIGRLGALTAGVHSHESAPKLLEAALRAELERAIAEAGGLTALDGATVVSPSLGVRAFGVILPIADRVSVMQASDAEPGQLTPFGIDERGARHRAAASVAHARPGSIVFVASADGELGCMLRDPNARHVLTWRFGALTARDG